MRRTQGQLSFSGPSCANIPGSTLINASVRPLPHPVTRQQSTAPRLHSPDRQDAPVGWAEPLPSQSPFSGHLPRARSRASLWMGPLAAYLTRVDNQTALDFMPPRAI